MQENMLSHIFIKKLSFIETEGHWSHVCYHRSKYVIDKISSLIIYKQSPPLKNKIGV